MPKTTKPIDDEQEDTEKTAPAAEDTAAKDDEDDDDEDDDDDMDDDSDEDEPVTKGVGDDEEQVTVLDSDDFMTFVGESIKKAVAAGLESIGSKLSEARAEIADMRGENAGLRKSVRILTKSLVPTTEMLKSLQEAGTLLKSQTAETDEAARLTPAAKVVPGTEKVLEKSIGYNGENPMAGADALVEKAKALQTKNDVPVAGLYDFLTLRTPETLEALSKGVAAAGG